MKEAYRWTSKKNIIQQILKNNDWSTCLDYMEETLIYHALQAYYSIDSEKFSSCYLLPITGEILT